MSSTKRFLALSIMAAAALAAASQPADARRRHAARQSATQASYDADGHVVMRAAPAVAGRRAAAVQDAPRRGGSGMGRNSTDTGKLPAPLQGWLVRVAGSCDGFKVVSTHRPGARVRGSGRLSLHANWKAADFEVSSWPCAYSVLKGFPGGVSTDATRVNHIHLSWAGAGGREWGARFAHWRPRAAGRAYARARHRHRLEVRFPATFAPHQRAFRHPFGMTARYVVERPFHVAARAGARRA